jgi:hypothetical protein
VQTVPGDDSFDTSDPNREVKHKVVAIGKRRWIMTHFSSKEVQPAASFFFSFWQLAVEFSPH